MQLSNVLTIALLLSVAFLPACTHIRVWGQNRSAPAQSQAKDEGSFSDVAAPVRPSSTEQTDAPRTHAPSTTRHDLSDDGWVATQSADAEAAEEHTKKKQDGTGESVVLAAFDRETWDLPTLEQLALAHNPTLVQGQARVSAAYGQWTQVGLYPNPVLSYRGAEIGDAGEAGQQGAAVSQQFVTAGKLGLNRHAASHEIERVQHEYQAQQYRVLTSVRKSFYNVLIAQRRSELTGELVKIGEKAVKDTTALYESQQVPKVDLIQSRVVANQARILHTNARNRETAAERELEAVLGVSLPQPIRLTARPLERKLLAGGFDAELEELSWEAMLAAVTGASPELAAAYADISRRRVALRRARVEPIPNVRVQAGAQYDFGGRLAIAQMQVGVPLPIYNRNEGNIQSAQAELIAAQHEVDRVQRNLEVRLARALQRYSSARYEVERYATQILKDSQEALSLVTRGYPTQFGSVRLLATQRNYFQTNIAYLEALRKWWDAKVEIDGLLLADGLSAPQ